MTLNPYSGCTCGRVWQSILPPPPCPVHGRSPRGWISVETTRTSGPCRGRHCAHDSQCFPPYVYNARWDRA